MANRRSDERNGHKMTIQQCKYVLAIARTGSFSQAAKQLFIAQSSLSVSIKSLENELGIRIFERTKDGVCLTDDGSEFVRYASRIAESEEIASSRYRSPEAVKKLHIATQHYDFIADIFGNFLSSIASESYRFSIKEIETYNVIREVETARSDIGIIAIKDGDFDVMKRYLSSKALTFFPLLTAYPHVFFRDGHPLCRCERLSPLDLREYPYVSYEQGEHNSAYFTEELMDEAGAARHIEISDRATLMNLLLITDAYTVGTGIMPSRLNRGDIVSIPLESKEYYTIGYILNEGRKLSEMGSEFIKLLEEKTKNI